MYAAKDLRLGRRVALKVLAAGRAESAASRARFQDEARAIARLNHPHICQLYDVGHAGEIDFLVMEYLEGETLAVTLKHAAVPLSRVLDTEASSLTRSTAHTIAASSTGTSSRRTSW